MNKLDKNKILKMLSIFSNQKASGFTLVELTVSIFIITLITAVAVVNIRDYKKTGNLSMTAQNLASFIRLAENYALNLKEFSPTATFPAGGWGVYISSSSTPQRIILFSDRDSSRDYNALPFPDEKVQDFIIPAGIAISDVRIGSNSRNTANIIFIPPDPKIFICSNGAACSSNSEANTISITLVSENISKSISANIFGLVEVN